MYFEVLGVEIFILGVVDDTGFNLISGGGDDFAARKLLCIRKLIYYFKITISKPCDDDIIGQLYEAVGEFMQHRNQDEAVIAVWHAEIFTGYVFCIKDFFVVS